MNFIPKDYSYEDFINFHLLSSVDLEFLKRGDKITKGLFTIVWNEEIKKPVRI